MNLRQKFKNDTGNHTVEANEKFTGDEWISVGKYSNEYVEWLESQYENEIARKVEDGVVIKFEEKFWGNHSQEGEGFGTLENADIHNPQFCTKTTDATYGKHSPHFKKLEQGEFVKIKKTTIILIELDEEIL